MDTILCVVRQWVGTTAANDISTIQNFINITVKREFKFENTFYEALSNILTSGPAFPYVIVGRGDLRLNDQSLEDTELEIQFLRNFGKYAEPVDLGTSDSKESHTTIRFQNEIPLRPEELEKVTDLEEYETLEVKIFQIRMVTRNIFSFFKEEITREQTLIGTCTVPLSEAFRQFSRNADADEWPIVLGTKQVGAIKLAFAFQNQHLSSASQTFSKLITAKILNGLEDIKKNVNTQLEILHGGSNDVDDVVKPLECQLNLENHENFKSTINHFVEISCPDILSSSLSSLSRKQSLPLFYNEKLIGDICSLLQQGTIKCPIKDITKDIIEIKISDTVTKVPEKYRSISEVYEQGEKMCVNRIPWKTGENLTVKDVPLHFEVKSGLKASSNGKQIGAAEMVKILLSILYFDDLNKSSNANSISDWNGHLDTTANNILTILRPCCTFNEWKAMEAWTLLEMRLLFPDMRFPSEVFNSCLRSAKNSAALGTFTFAIQHYKMYCLQKISQFKGHGEHDEDEINQVKCMIESLTRMPDFEKLEKNNEEDYEELRNTLHIHIGKQVLTNIKETMRTDVTLRNTIAMLENYELSMKGISEKFDNFAVNIWCPVLATNVANNILPLLESSLNQFKSEYGNTTEFRKKSHQIYCRIKAIFRYGNAEDIRKIEPKFYQIFEDWLPLWIELVKDKAEIQIKRVFETEDRKELEKTNSLSRQKSNDLFARLVEIETAKQIVEIFNGCIKTWKALQWPNLEKNIEIGFEFLRMLHELFQYYIRLLEETILDDDEFDHSEYSSAMQSIFLIKYQYLNDLWPNELKEKAMTTNEDQGLVYEEKIKMMKLDVKETVERFTDKFCSFQKKYFKNFLNKYEGSITTHNGSGEYYRGTNRTSSQIRLTFYNDINEDGTFDGHLVGILNFLLQKYEQYVRMYQPKDSEFLPKYLENEMFKVAEHVIQDYFTEITINRESSADTEVFAHLRNIVQRILTLQETFSLPESKSLTDLYNKLELKSATTLKLISKDLECVYNLQSENGNQSDLESTGDVRYTAGRLGSKIYVSLRNVANLKPRKNKESCNFKIAILLLPTSNDPSRHFVKKSTPVCYDQTHLLFDIDETDEPNFKFDFELGNEATNYEYGGIKQYLELNLYDVSSAKFFKYFRGHTLLPLHEIPVIQNLEEFEQLQLRNDKFLFSTVNDERTSVHTELRLRNDEFAKEYIRKLNYYTKNAKTPTKTR